jgi:hypothetical protein
MNRCSTLIVLAAMTVFAGCADWFKPEPVKLDVDKETLDARVELMTAADSKDPAIRCHAIEALEQTLGAEAASVYLQALSDPNQSVRFVATNAVGDLKLAQAKDALLRAMNDPATEKSVQAATIYALHSIGADVYTDASGQEASYISWLGRLLFDEDKTVRANTALAMGNIGVPSALGPMRALFADEREPMVQLQLIESMALLGDARSASLMEAYTKSNFMDERLAAIPAVARLALPRGTEVLSELLSPAYPPQVRVAAFGALARMGDVKPDGYKLAIAALNEPRMVLEKSYEGVRRPDDREVTALQALAAISLGWTACDEAIVALRPAAHSPSGAIRVEAAMSTLRLLSRYKHIAPPDGAILPRPIARPGVKAPLPGPSAGPVGPSAGPVGPSAGATTRPAPATLPSTINCELPPLPPMSAPAREPKKVPSPAPVVAPASAPVTPAAVPAATPVPAQTSEPKPAPAPAVVPAAAPSPATAPSATVSEDQTSTPPAATTRPSGFKTSGIKD